MRKATALLMVLVLLCAGCIITAHGVINTQRDQVVIKENVIYGDKMAAEGLNIIRKCTWDERLHWKTDYNIASENRYSTEFHFTQNREYERYGFGRVTSMLSFGCYTNGGIGSSAGIEHDDIERNFKGFEDICLGVMERAPMGSEYAETVKLSDYHEFYPLNINLDMQDQFYLYRDPEISDFEYVRTLEGDQCFEVNEALRAFFKIPVPEDETVEVRVYKEEDGTVTEVHLNSYNAQPKSCDFHIISEGISDKGVYFAFDCGDDIDFTHIPGGCGIYLLPYGASFTHDGSTYPTVDTDGLAMVYPLDTDVVIESLFYDDSMCRLVMITVEDGAYMFNSIDPDTMETVQRFVIDICREEGGVWNVTCEEDFVVLYLQGSRLAVLNTASGEEYELDYVVDLCPADAEELFWYNGSSVMAYDGERLALAWSIERDSHPYSDCGFCVAVYDHSGLRYYGEYESGLMTGEQSNDYGYYCSPVGGESVLLRWG